MIKGFQVRGSEIFVLRTLGIAGCRHRSRGFHCLQGRKVTYQRKIYLFHAIQATSRDMGLTDFNEARSAFSPFEQYSLVPMSLIRCQLETFHVVSHLLKIDSFSGFNSRRNIRYVRNLNHFIIAFLYKKDNFRQHES